MINAKNERTNKRVKQHITSYVLDVITDKRTNHDEL